MYTENLIEKYCASGEYDKALEVARGWVLSEQTEPKAYAQLAFVYNFLDQLSDALSAVEKAIGLSSIPQPALFFSKALYLFKAGNYKDCENAFMACCSSSVNGYYVQAARLGLAKVHYLTSSYREALESLKDVDDDASMWLGGLVHASELRHEIERRLMSTQSMKLKAVAI